MEIKKILLNLIATSIMYTYLIFNEILSFITLVLLIITFFTSLENFIKIKEAWYIIVYLIFNFVSLISKIDYIYLIFKFSKRKKIIKRNFKKFFILNIINIIFMILNVYSLNIYFIIPYILNFICLIILKIEEKYSKEEPKRKKRKRRNNDIELRRYQM